MATNTATKNKPAPITGVPVEIMSQRMKSVSDSIELADWQWERLKAAVDKCLQHLVGRRLEECVLIVRHLVSCNSQQLEGLPKRFRVWSKPSVAAVK